MQDWRRMWPVAFALGLLLLLAALLLCLAPITSHGDDCGPLVAPTGGGILSGCDNARATRRIAVATTGIAGVVLVVTANTAWWGLRDQDSDRDSTV